MMPIDTLAKTPEPVAPAKPTIVIVHGAWGGSWAFRNVDRMLRQKGFDVYRPSLTGQGERVHLASPDIGLRTHIDDVVNAIIFEDLHDVVLVGHSYGGMVISGVADRIPERIHRLIYLDAFVPDDKESVMKILGPRADWAENMVKNGFMVPPWIDKQPWPYDVPQSLKTFTEPISLINPATKKIPVTYILTVEEGKKAEDDDFASAAERAKKRGWRVLQMEADHNPQFSAPQELADMLSAEAK
jgi:pimeloyl-ACP methyl ester carboxylesterase